MGCLTPIACQRDTLNQTAYGSCRARTVGGRIPCQTGGLAFSVGSAGEDLVGVIANPEVPVVTEQAPLGETVADPTEEESPGALEVPAEEPKAGDIPDADGRGEGFDPKSLTDDQWEVLRANDPQREEQRREDQRTQTREQEMQGYRDAVQEGTRQMVETSRQAQAYVSYAASELERDLQLLDIYGAADTYSPDKLKEVQQKIAGTLNSQTLREALSAVESGALVQADANAALYRTQALANLRDLGEHLDLQKSPLTRDETKLVDDARYRDLQRGRPGFEGSARLFQVLMDRHGKSEYERGKQAGLRDRQARADLADKLKNLTAVKNGAAPRLEGQPSNASDDQSRLDRVASGTGTAEDKAWFSQRYPDRRS